jgi:hypothetical protein
MGSYEPHVRIGTPIPDTAYGAWENLCAGPRVTGKGLSRQAGRGLDATRPGRQNWRVRVVGSVLGRSSAGLTAWS